MGAAVVWMQSHCDICGRCRAPATAGAAAHSSLLQAAGVVARVGDGGGDEKLLLSAISDLVTRRARQQTPAVDAAAGLPPQGRELSRETGGRSTAWLDRLSGRRAGSAGLALTCGQRSNAIADVIARGDRRARLTHTCGLNPRLTASQLNHWRGWVGPGKHQLSGDTIWRGSTCGQTRAC